MFLKCQIGNVDYVIDCKSVIEVVPLTRLEQVPGTPEAVAGFFYYRGIPVAVIDPCPLLFDRPSRKRFSTRILLTQYSANQMLGLIVESATDTVQESTAKRIEIVSILPQTIRDLLPVLRTMLS